MLDAHRARELPLGEGEGRRFGLAAQEIRHGLLHRRSLEETGVRIGVEARDVAEYEVAELGLVEPALLDVLVSFFNTDPLDPLFGVFGAMGNIDFLTTQSDLQVVPNANAIVIFTFPANPIFRNWSFVFGVTS